MREVEVFGGDSPALPCGSRTGERIFLVSAVFFDGETEDTALRLKGDEEVVALRTGD